ncbi:alpha/beta fold hydrolase [Spirosoma jeollabukense]
MLYFANMTRLNVLDTGHGSLTLVFLHYFGGSALEWQTVMDQLSDTYRCLAVDLRGHGDSDAPATGYSVETMADDVVDLLDMLDVRDFVLVGHSLSSKVAFALASRQPIGLQSLVLLSPSPPKPEPIPDADRKDMLETHGQRSAAEKTFAKITVRPLSEMVREQIIADNLRTSEAAWKAWLIFGSKEDISAQMSGINVPVSILVGTEDKALPPDVQPLLTLPYLKNATFETIDNAGHLLPWEAPDDVAAFIRKKLARLYLATV